MKYKELEKIAMKADYNIIDDPNRYCMKHRYRNNCISVNKTLVKFIFINNEHCRPEDFEVIKAAMELAETPLEERHEEKKYYLKHSFMCGFEKDTFLNVDDLNRAVYLGSNAQSSSIQTQFTQAEIDEIKEKYKTTLDDFEQIEAEK